MNAVITTTSNRWYFRASILACLVLTYTVSEHFFNKLAEQHNGLYTVNFTLPLPPEVILQENLPADIAIERVYVSGFFTDWQASNPRFKLAQQNRTLWSKTLQLTPGHNQYKFVVFFKGRDEPVWLYDYQNPARTQDSHDNFNSVATIPDIEYYRFIFMLALFSVTLFMVIYYFAEPVLLWVLRQKLPFRSKLTLSLTFVVVLSNTLFIALHIYESRQIVKQGIIDSIHLVHLFLQSQEVDFESIRQQQPLISTSINQFLWNAKVRVEKSHTSPTQITLSDIALLDTDFRIITLNHRQQNQSLQLERAKRYGFSTTEAYFLDGVLAPIIRQGKRSHRPATLFTHPGKNVLKYETPKTRLSRKFLGFSNFLYPIYENNQHVGYYAGSIQVKLYGAELQRILIFNLILLALMSALTTLLLANLGHLITGYLDQLAQWTKRIVIGDYGHRVTISSHDEIQVLAENFAKMHDTLESSFHEIEEKTRQLEIDAYVDTLTKLPNRKRMHSDLRNRPAQGLLLFNIDSFRGLNDFFGNEVGDHILTETAKRFSERTTAKEFKLYRIGSDEFVTTINATRTEQEVEQIVNDLCDAIAEQPYRIQSNEIYVSITAGIALENTGTELKKPLHSRAEIALRKAKIDLVKYRTYIPAIESLHEFESNMTWTNRLRQAIDEDRIEPFFQPIVNNTTHKIDKYECLVRLRERNGHIIPPAMFLDISKKAKFYPFITQIMLTKSFAAFEHNEIDFTINLSLEDILNRRTLQGITHILERNPNTAKRATFEIVETAEIKNYEVVTNFIKTVKAYQCKIAIDDFGAGYSNFAHILSLNIDYLKIDGSLIKNLDHDTNAQAITQTIVAFAHKMNIKTIAEFVHNEEVLEKSREYGITYSQGFYLGEPSPHLIGQP